MIAKGSDCSDYFPAVVKNVVAKNSEVCRAWDIHDLHCLSTGQETGVRLSSSLCRRAAGHSLAFH